MKSWTPSEALQTCIEIEIVLFSPQTVKNIHKE